MLARLEEAMHIFRFRPHCQETEINVKFEAFKVR
jgi:hypothetical protein